MKIIFPVSRENGKLENIEGSEKIKDKKYI